MARPNEEHIVDYSKTALVTSENVWFSSRLIQGSIAGVYQRMAPDLYIIDYGLETEAHRKQVAAAIKARGIKKLIFASSDPHPYFFLVRLSASLDQIKELCFHLYGDFSVLTPEWVKLLDLVKNKKIKIIVASAAQKRLVDVFLGTQNRDTVVTVPFPHFTSRSFVTQKRRLASRIRLGLKDNDFLLIYSGRLAQEKNVTLLVDFFRNFLERNPGISKNLKLAIAGGFDDSSHYFLNKSFSKGGFARHWQKWYSAMPASVRKRVHFAGFLNRAELNHLYDAADVFVSLSTFHDEDFGLAPVEALTSGCPAILSSWGGYSSFAIDKENVGLVPVRISTKGLEIDYLAFERNLLYFCRRKLNVGTRRNCGKFFREKFSIKSISDKFTDIHCRSFRQPNLRPGILNVHAHKLNLLRQGEGKVFSSYSSRDPFYRRIYRSYLNAER